MTHTAIDFEEFLSGYLSAACWLVLDEDSSGDGDEASPDEIPAEIVAEIESDCLDFCEANESLLVQSGLTAHQAGFDFYLTRNGHGSGFWDRGIGAVGEALTKASKPYGEQVLLRDADGNIFA